MARSVNLHKRTGTINIPPLIFMTYVDIFNDFNMYYRVLLVMSFYITMLSYVGGKLVVKWVNMQDTIPIIDFL